MAKTKLILGSASPRRKELLTHVGVPFEIRVSNVDETSSEKNPANHCLEIALRKAEGLLKLNPDHSEIIITSDTVVAIDDEILGKPLNVEDAKRMLLKLSGREHLVATALVIHFYHDGWKMKSHVSSTKVTFDKMSPETLERYLASLESLDKAGSYGIQGQSLSFISKIEGCYASVVGFPLAQFVKMMEHDVAKSLNWEKPWRSYF
jgi:septum formation protein